MNGEVKFLGKFKKENIFNFFFLGGGVGLGGGGQGGCERRIEVFVKILKKRFFWGGGGGSGRRGVRVHVNEK